MRRVEWRSWNAGRRAIRLSLTGRGLPYMAMEFPEGAGSGQFPAGGNLHDSGPRAAKRTGAGRPGSVQGDAEKVVSFASATATDEERAFSITAAHPFVDSR